MSGSYRFNLECASHVPSIPMDNRDRTYSLDDLRMVYRDREAMWAVPDDLWAQEWYHVLWWLRVHRDCHVRAYDEHGHAELDAPEAIAGEAQPGAEGDPKSDEPRRAGLAYLGYEDILRMLGQESYGRGYRLQAAFADPAREAVGLVLTHPDLRPVAQFCEPPMLNAGVEFEHKVIDGEVWTRPVIKITEPE